MSFCAFIESLCCKLWEQEVSESNWCSRLMTESHSNPESLYSRHFERKAPFWKMTPILWDSCFVLTFLCFCSCDLSWDINWDSLIFFCCLLLLSPLWPLLSGCRYKRPVKPNGTKAALSQTRCHQGDQPDIVTQLKEANPALSVCRRENSFFLYTEVTLLFEHQRW